MATDTGTWVLPPSRALWIPAGIGHETHAPRASTLRVVYLDPDGCPVAWSEPQPLRVGTLLAALLMHPGDEAPGSAGRSRAEAVLPRERVRGCISPGDRHDAGCLLRSR